MTDYRDGKIHGWNGGECPVHPKDRVTVWFRGTGLDGPTFAEDKIWRHGPYSWDIIAFCVTKKHAEPAQVAEPLTMWVNIYDDGDRLAFASKYAAERCRFITPGRIAVPFREVKE